MALIKCPECNSEISSQAEACPKCGYSLRKRSEKKSSSGCGAGCLVIIIIFALIWIFGSVSDYDSGSSRSSRISSRPSTSSYQSPQLELLDWNWRHEYGYAMVEGQVKNITSEPLKNIEAVVTFTDAKGTFITTGDALIDFNPILPSQISPFKAMATWNPAMNKASVQFKSLFGRTIPHRKRE